MSKIPPCDAQLAISHTVVVKACFELFLVAFSRKTDFFLVFKT